MQEPPSASGFRTANSLSASRPQHPPTIAAKGPARFGLSFAPSSMLDSPRMRRNPSILTVVFDQYVHRRICHHAYVVSVTHCVKCRQRQTHFTLHSSENNLPSTVCSPLQRLSCHASLTDSFQPSTRRCAAPKSMSPQKSSGRFTTMGSGVLRTTTHRKGTSLEGLISWCGSHAGT